MPAKVSQLMLCIRAVITADPKVPHLVKRDEVEKAIKFFKELVKVTDGVTL